MLMANQWSHHPGRRHLREALTDGECSAQSVLFDCRQFVARRRATGGPDIGVVTVGLMLGLRC
ncbi:hypothetical protein AO501_30020 [Mycobacterium gordonae]|uniref:Uncharacterized protein n=1 Tax=Mycobacterium gordonae TaxID=1778 RepID=A0A0Q2MFE5_MYCGO|nr:hypothetical protein AO501_30020 [Mycobacterium gordonae]